MYPRVSWSPSFHAMAERRRAAMKWNCRQWMGVDIPPELWTTAASASLNGNHEAFATLIEFVERQS